MRTMKYLNSTHLKCIKKKFKCPLGYHGQYKALHSADHSKGKKFAKFLSCTLQNVFLSLFTLTTSIIQTGAVLHRILSPELHSNMHSNCWPLTCSGFRY